MSRIVMTGGGRPMVHGPFELAVAAGSCSDMLPAPGTARLLRDEYGEFGGVTYPGQVITISETAPGRGTPSASLGPGGPVRPA